MGLGLSQLWGRLFGASEKRIVLIGLDNAGKTSTLYQLHMGEAVETQPTIGSNVESVVHRNVHFIVHDLGGHESARAGWANYYSGTNAVIIVVDSTDRQRITLVRDELWKLLGNSDLAGAVILVFANKQDLKSALPATSSSSSSTDESESLTHSSATTAAASSSSSSSSSSSAPISNTCMSAAEIAESLNLQAIKTHTWHIQACSALTGEGLYEGIEFITNAVTSAKS